MDILSELLIAKTPLTATELAERLRCPVGKVLAEVGRLWWEILPQASADGWRYEPRKLLKSRMPKEDSRDKYGEPISRSKYTT